MYKLDRVPPLQKYNSYFNRSIPLFKDVYIVDSVDSIGKINIMDALEQFPKEVAGGLAYKEKEMDESVYLPHVGVFILSPKPNTFYYFETERKSRLYSLNVQLQVAKALENGTNSVTTLKNLFRLE